MFSSSLSISGRPKLSLSPNDLPPLPARLGEVLAVANDPDITLVALDRVISRDQALTMRVLAVANSSYYGCSRRIESVRSAVALLGVRQVQNIASALTMAQAFVGEAGPGLWRHGLACAVWSEKIFIRLGLPSVDLVFTSALLHDIGIVVMLARAADRYQPCLDLARASGRPLAECERELIGWDHAELGGQLCRTWRLPDRIAELIERHDAPGAKPDLAHLVLALADRFASACGTPELAWMTPAEVPTALVTSLGLSTVDVEDLLAQSNDVASETSIFA